MIEFAAECGHTIRARDDDAGRLVRCTYCGRDAKVPDEQVDDLDLLLREVQQAEGAAEASSPRRRRKHAKGSSRFGLGRKGRGQFNPFALVFKLCWWAGLVIVVVVVTQKVVLPLINARDSGPSTSQPRATRPTDESSGRGSGRPSRDDGQGLNALRGSSGLYVSSVPDSGEVFWISASEAPRREGRINTESRCQRAKAGDVLGQAKSGTYVVEVAIPWNDPRLVGYPEYTQFRRTIDGSSEQSAAVAADQYFLPDGASNVLVEKTTWGQIYLIRQYRDVEVRDGRWTAVHSLFLPNLTDADSGLLAVDKIMRWLPTETKYSFDQQHVRNELNYYGVPESDQQYVLDALRRIGVLPYVTPADGRTRLFSIDIDNGTFAARIIR